MTKEWVVGYCANKVELWSWFWSHGALKLCGWRIRHMHTQRLPNKLKQRGRPAELVPRVVRRRTSHVMLGHSDVDLILYKHKCHQ